MRDAHIRVPIGDRWRRQLDIKIVFRVRRFAHKAGIAVLQERLKIRIGRVHPDGDTADRNHHAVTLDLCG